MASSITFNGILDSTIECNTLNINKHLVKTLKNINCSRVSLGVQSFSKKALSFCDRAIYGVNEVNNAIRLLEEANISISIDLINGLPYSDFDFELKSLESVLSEHKQLKHISFYELSIEKGSKFYDFNNLQVPILSKKIKYENEFRKLISKYGFKRYEISNYAKQKNFSLHNLAYWKYKNYIGLGPSAHSTIDSLRIENKPDIDLYIKQKEYCDSYYLSKFQQIQEYILMGFRLIEGISVLNFYERFNIPFFDLFNKTIKIYTESKLIIIKNNKIKMSNRGLNILNSILVDFFKELDEKEKMFK